MIRALNTGVLGMRQFQTSLDVIGNNLANINTVAYKGARVEFQDTLSQTLRAPTPDTATTSGAAGMQVGNGMAVSAIKNTFTQGAMKNTGVRTDMSVNGKGFFLVKDPTTNELFATRAGDFREDKNGYLVTNDGFRVQGKNKLAPAYTTAQQTEIGDLRLDVGQYTADRTGVSLDYSTNVLTKTAHGFSTGNQIKFPSTLPAIANDTNTVDKVFFVNKASDDTFTVHSTAAEAATGANAVNFTDSTVTAKTGFTTDTANDKITLASHGLTTGNTVYVKEGTIPGGLTAVNPPGMVPSLTYTVLPVVSPWLARVILSLAVSVVNPVFAVTVESVKFTALAPVAASAAVLCTVKVSSLALFTKNTLSTVFVSLAMAGRVDGNLI